MKNIFSLLHCFSELDQSEYYSDLPERSYLLSVWIFLSRSCKFLWEDYHGNTQGKIFVSYTILLPKCRPR